MNEAFAQRTEIWRGKDEIIRGGLQELYNTKVRYDYVVDHNGPSIMINNEFVVMIGLPTNATTVLHALLKQHKMWTDRLRSKGRDILVVIIKIDQPKTAEACPGINPAKIYD